MNLYLDASAVVALISGQEAGALVDPIVRETVDGIIVTDFVFAETSAALARLARVERWPGAVANFVFDELDAWAATIPKIEAISSADIATAEHFVRLPGILLRAPDAIHIAAAHRLGATLLTLDKGMARAAAALGFPHLNPAEA